MKTLRFIGMALLSLFMCVNFAACSDDENSGQHGEMTKVIHVEKAGTLSTLMSVEEQEQVTDLTLSGYINGTDVGFIQGLYNLTKADFTDLHIVGGGSYFVYSGLDERFYSHDNVFPAYMFVTKLEMNLREIKLPNSIKEIGEYAFYYCDDLTSIQIPSSVTKIRKGAFSSCSSLTSIEIPNSVTEIGEGAFSSCSSLTSIEIPNSVTEIGNYVFSGCESLTSVVIPNSVTKIGSNTFEDCTNLASIEMGNAVTEIQGGAFAGCTALKEVHIKSSTPPNIVESAFSTYAYVTLYVPVGSKDTYMQHKIWGQFGNIVEE